MAVTNGDRVKTVLDDLDAPLRKWATPRLEALFGQPWLQAVVAQAPLPHLGSDHDIWVVLTALARHWPDLVDGALTSEDRRSVESLADMGLEIAQSNGSLVVSSDRCERLLSDGERFAKSLGEVELATSLADARAEFRRVRFLEDQERQRKLQARELDVQIAPGALPAWRDVVTPHDDVATGEFQLADFAADLRLVHEGKARVEYADPSEFFARTYMTDGLSDLLRQTVLRMNGAGGDPLLDLMTTFGGGKTHSMLAVYHAVSGVPIEQMDGMRAICESAGVQGLPDGVNRALIVGDNLSTLGSRKDDGTHVKTLLGEIAWQLGGRAAFDQIAEFDQQSVPVPSGKLEDLLNAFSPCVILIDEWVIYLRQLVGLVAGSDRASGDFESNISGVQALTSALKGAPRAMLIASLPASDVVRDMPAAAHHMDNPEELGGSGGVEALRALRSVIHRTERPWQPASLEESFEIVRRRLFRPFDAKQEAARSTVVEGFRRYYFENQRDLPSEAVDSGYANLLRHAYPVHPELFTRLFEDWSTLERFQRTRGVLRLMATVVHSLWTRGDTGAVILPASIPLDDPAVAEEFARVLDDKWQPVINTDLAGQTSTAAQIDRKVALYGRTSATQRVARCVFLGSVPFANRRDQTGQLAVNRGIERKRIMLGSIYPGDNLGNTVGALKNLATDATYVNNEDDRYSLGLNRTLAQLVREKADGFHDTDIADELIALIRAERDNGQFPRVSRCPGTTADVDDTPTLALVILGPDRPYKKADKGKAPSPAEAAALEFLTMRGNQARVNRNTMLFVAPDQSSLETLLKLVRTTKAWKAVVDDADSLNITPAMKRTAESTLAANRKSRDESIGLTFKWFLYAEQQPGERDISITSIPMDQGGTLAERATKKATTSDHIYPLLSVSTLRLWIDKLNLWQDEPHVQLGTLADYFAQHIYLPTLTKPDVLLHTVRERPDTTLSLNDGFAYASGFEGGRYVGLTTEPVQHPERTGLLVEPAIARQQIIAETPVPDTAPTSRAEPTNPGDDISPERRPSPTVGPITTSPSLAPGKVTSGQAASVDRLYAHMSVDIDRPVKVANALAQEVLKHLAANGVSVKLTLDLEANGLAGMDQTLVADILNNLKTIGFEVDPT